MGPSRPYRWLARVEGLDWWSDQWPAEAICRRLGVPENIETAALRPALSSERDSEIAPTALPSRVASVTSNTVGHHVSKEVAMAVVGLGVDLVEVDHFRRLKERDNVAALERMFTKAELAALPSNIRAGERLAGWFSAKEAVLKALGVGQSQGVAWTDVEVATNSVGAPSVTLTGRAEEVARDHRIEYWVISISHTTAYATATAIGLSGEPPGGP